jgi:hypothetical protein
MRILSVLVLSLMFTAMALTADAQMAILSGTLTDPTGAFITGAQVKATGKDEKEFQAKTNSLGVYAFELPVASYRIEFKVTGCDSFVIPEYVITDEKRPVLDAELPDQNCKSAQYASPVGNLIRTGAPPEILATQLGPPIAPAADPKPPSRITKGKKKNRKL